MTLPKPKAWDDLNIGGCFSWEGEGPLLHDALQIVQPQNILEIGFFAAASSFIFLQLSAAKVTSVDPMVNLHNPNEPHTGRPENVQKLKDHFGADRFTFIQKSSEFVRPDLMGQKFDLMLIDGDHWTPMIRNDLQLALDLDIPWILMDDFVTSVEQVYYAEFAKYFDMVRLYPRPDHFMGKPIPLALAKRK